VRGRRCGSERRATMYPFQDPDRPARSASAISSHA
jgi:hypothetical protein